MTQQQQVIAAIQKIGGKGTTSEIAKAITNIDSWKTKTPIASVASYLCTSDTITRDGKNWMYKDPNIIQKPDNKNIKSNPGKKIKGLYIITLSSETKKHVTGFAFKVGSAENIRSRINTYNASLPFTSVEHLESFPLMDKTLNEIRQIETKVREKLLNNKSLGFRISECHNGRQREWLKILNHSMKREEIVNLVHVTRKIIEGLT